MTRNEFVRNAESYDVDQQIHGEWMNPIDESKTDYGARVNCQMTAPLTTERSRRQPAIGATINIKSHPVRDFSSRTDRLIEDNGQHL